MSTGNKSAILGLIHMSCYCGADLIYLGNRSPEQFTVNVIDELKNKIGAGNYGIFTGADGAMAACPYCGLNYELPDPDLMDWLPFLDQNRFTDVVSQIARSIVSSNGHSSTGTSTGRYIL